MKRIFIFFFFSLWVISCSKSDPIPEATAEDLIIGKWYFKRLTLTDGSMSQPDNDCERQTYYEFSADGTLQDVTYVLDGDECKSMFSRFDYSLTSDGKMLVVTASDGSTILINILTLDENSLEIEVDSGMIVLFEKPSAKS
ncbi:MAG: lipocalin family protein [Proteiniphilum sp.]|nr:lipocalin family protein [Proteiniphilum sp.]MDD2513130.1 lipocalin family protein [Proteiniphilum sp.]